MSSTPPLGSLYQALILDHYRRPRNRGELADANGMAHVHNPTCGDEIILELRVDDGRIEDVRFRGEGCSISQASASMMTQLLRGRTATEVSGLADEFRMMLRGGGTPPRELGDLRALAGVSKFPARVKCALLGWEALANALANADSA
jgi:nitrogen fixation NifU-like protein